MENQNVYFAAKHDGSPIVSGHAEVMATAAGQFFLRPLVATNNIASVSESDFGKIDTALPTRPIVFAASEQEAVAALEKYIAEKR